MRDPGSMSLQGALQDADGIALEYVSDSLELRARPNVRKLQLQVQHGSNVELAMLLSRTGVKLPASPSEPVNDTHTSYWLSPNNWLLLDPKSGIKELHTSIEEIAPNVTTSVIDVSDGWSVMELAGENVLARLTEGCSADLEPTVSSIGRYWLTRLQHVAVILHRIEVAPRFRILVDRTYARFLWDWLVDGDCVEAVRRQRNQGPPATPQGRYTAARSPKR